MRKSVKLATGFWPSLLLLEAAASYIAYGTIGWVAPALLIPLILVVDFFILIAYCLRFQLGILLGSLFLMVTYVFIAPLGVRWYYVDRETRRIISWAKAEKAKAGEYPDDLNGYIFQRPGYRDYIHYYKDPYQPGLGFGVCYIVGTENTHHRYDPEYGWYYQDD